MDPANIVKHGNFCLADSRKLHVVKAGSSGENVLFIHGYVDSWKSFGRMFPFLTKHLAVVAYDQRGHGESDEAGTYAMADFVADAIEVIEAQVAEPIHVIGHSLGAIVAHRIASERPDLVRSITLIGGAIASTGNAALGDFYEQVRPLSDPVPYSFAYDFQKSTAFQPLAEDVLNEYVKESLKVGARVWKQALLGLLEDVTPTNGSAPHVPTLVLWGEHDEIFPLPDQITLRRWLGDATFINYSELGHAPQWEDPARVSHDILKFISCIRYASH